jgi:hypothetical protein
VLLKVLLLVSVVVVKALVLNVVLDPVVVAPISVLVVFAEMEKDVARCWVRVALVMYADRLDEYELVVSGNAAP